MLGQTQYGVRLTVFHWAGLSSYLRLHLPLDPTRLVLRALAQRKPFIAVNINYRLGIFGFGFSSDIMEMQQSDAAITGGNFGLGDQRVALIWVSQNIPAFGGDPTRITIAGQSAGGISVHSHILEAKFSSQQPLFRRAIQQSGGNGVLGPTDLEELDRRWARFYDSLGLSGQSSKEKVAHVLGLPPSDLLSTAMKLGWITYDVAKDGLTVRDRGGGRWSFHLGRRENQTSQSLKGPRQPICVLVGDCEDEVSNMKRLERSLKCPTDTYTGSVRTQNCINC